ncbi:MAG: sigma-54 dependent transcriptional regulator [Bacteroidetes bacterium]|nr:sigma-54 dependent transcriptional regulator [Bacteroidota bacterium]
MSSLKIFVVEDDTWYAGIIEHYLLKNPDYEVEKFHDASSCLENLFKAPSVITLDYSLPDMNGLECMRRIKKRFPEIPVIIISGQREVATAVDLIKEGAYDYIVKDEDALDRLWNVLRILKENLELREENIRLKDEMGGKYEFSRAIIGNSEVMKKVFSIMKKATDSNINISIYGETGTGKELIAKSIHYNSSRRKNPFVPVNVSAIPEELIESELFGHEKGAFTGAGARRTGKFEEANNGTLLLDEIADMSMNMQAKVLRALQEREISRIGSNKIIKLNVRVITATHKDLADEVRAGNFRKDLYYRILGIPINLPALRERGHDILQLARYFADNFCKENNFKTYSFSREAKEKLLSYHFPGNVRELRAIIEMAVVMSDNNQIEAGEISFHSPEPPTGFLNMETTLENYTVQIIKHFLEKYNHNAITVAEKLDIGKSTIYRMIKKHNL